MIDIKFKMLTAEAVLPQKENPEDAGIDFFTQKTKEGVVLAPGSLVTVDLGVACEFPQGFVLMFKDRSSIGALGVHVFAGVIDSGYRGELKLVLYNTSKSVYRHMKPGSKIVQGLLLPFVSTRGVSVDELSSSKRGKGGFSSTGT